MRKELEIQWRLGQGHPNIAKTHCYFYDAENVYSVLEYAPHGNLYQKLRRCGRFNEPIARSIIQQIVSALYFCQQRNVIHRDIKPENILVFESCPDDTEPTGVKPEDSWRHGWLIKLCDFGWATHSINQNRMTFCGTPDYLAPELLTKTPYDDKIDNWAVGILTYELLTGASPFDPNSKDNENNGGEQNDANSIYRNIRNVDLCFNRTYQDQVSDLAKDFIGSILRSDPRNRMSLLQIAEHPWLD